MHSTQPPSPHADGSTRMGRTRSHPTACQLDDGIRGWNVPSGYCGTRGGVAENTAVRIETISRS